MSKKVVQRGKPKNVFGKFIKFAFLADKRYFFAVAFKAIVNAGTTVFNVYSLSIILKYLENGIYKDALIAGAIVVALNTIINFLNKLLIRIFETGRTRVFDAISAKITTKLMHLPYQYLEDPYYLDLKERAKFAIENQGAIDSFLTTFSETVQIIITLIGLITIMITFDVLLLVIVVVATIFNVLILAIQYKTLMKFYTDLIPINRRFGYYLNTINDYNKAKDYRIFTLGKLMQNQFAHYSNETATSFKKFYMKLIGMNCSMNLIKYTEMGLVYGFVAIKTIARKLSVSSFSLYISSAINFSTLMTQLLNQIMNINQTVAYLTPFVELIELEEETDSGKHIPFNGEIEAVEFVHVTFKYPKSDNVIISDVSFKINKGEKISIVGLNGAGKTTMIKLLCRLYKPTTGDIYVNGISIYDYEYHSYMQAISAVFQDFKIFAYSLKENILNEDGEEKIAYEVASKVGLKDKIDALPSGINSLYSKAYDEKGIEMSGGEAQKLAIARALYKHSSLVILDEPTSALDPLAEADIYKNFNDLVLSKTAIYISHRMSSSVFCDRILIIDGGKVADFDTHANLMLKTDSLYYKLFMSQAKNYRIENN